MFWGLVLEPYKKYTQKVDQSFHISQAALDLNSCSQADTVSQLVVEYENSNFILATLSKKASIYQVPLDLIFKTGDQISFRVIGSGKVHLSGYHVLEDLDNMVLNGEEESDLEEVNIEEDKRKRKKSTPNSKGGKKAKVGNINEEESDEEYVFDEDDESSDEESEDEKKVEGKKTKGKKRKDDTVFALDDDEDDDEADEDEDYEEEEDDEGDDDDDDDDDEDEEVEEEIDTNEDDDDEQQKTPKSEKKKNTQTPNGLPTSTRGNKAEQKLNQSSKDIIPGTPMKTPKNEKSFKNADREATPKEKKNDLSKKGDKTPKSPRGEDSPQKKVLEGGVVSEELKLGNGPVAKPGKMANVYYVGTLSTTKKQFDAVQNGPGFKFRIGRNEVIRGWDIGIIGMKVGGKRRLTIPPHLAYGSKGSPPVIPPNSTLVFTVELKGLS